VVLLVAGCGNLTCDQQKQKAIKHMNLGVEAANSQSFATAEKELETAMSLDPENHRAAYALGQVYIEQRKWEQAEGALETAVKFNPRDAMYQYHLGHARYELGKLDQARLALEESVKQNKRLYKAHFYLGKIHAAQERPKDAATAWTESCRLNPGFGKPFYELGKLYFEWDHHQEAIQVLVQGAANARDAEDLSDINHQLGMSYDALKQYDKSVEAYEKALEARKDNLEARFQLGMAYAAKGDKAKARKYLEEFVKQGGSGNTFLIQAANDRLLKLTGE
jgi:tetratricopeptide (TPR) repeat protein